MKLCTTENFWMWTYLRNRSKYDSFFWYDPFKSSDAAPLMSNNELFKGEVRDWEKWACTKKSIEKKYIYKYYENMIEVCEKSQTEEKRGNVFFYKKEKRRMMRWWTTSRWRDPIAHFSLNIFFVVFTFFHIFLFQLYTLYVVFFVVGCSSLKIKQLNCQGKQNQLPYNTNFNASIAQNIFTQTIFCRKFFQVYFIYWSWICPNFTYITMNM